MTLDDAMKYWAEFKSQVERTQAKELYRGVIKSPPGAVLEVGSAAGGTTVVLIAAAQEAGKRVISIDPYPEELEGSAEHYIPGAMRARKLEFQKNILNRFENVTQINEDVSSCVGELPLLSMVFIDGLHELDFVLRDIRLLYPLLVPGGYMYLHDVDWKHGQLSGTTAGGLCNLPRIDWGDMWDNKDETESMLRWRKSNG